jgi:hypothetical protein
MSDPTTVPPARNLRWWGSDCDECGNTTPGSMTCDECHSNLSTRRLFIERRRP